MTTQSEIKACMAARKDCGGYKFSDREEYACRVTEPGACAAYYVAPPTRAEQIEAAAMAVLKNTKVFKSEAITDPALWRALGAALTLPPDPEPDLARILEQAFVACGRAGANANTRHPLRPLWELLNRATDTSWTLLNMTPESVAEEEPGLSLGGKELDPRELGAILAGLRMLANCTIADDESDMTSDEILDIATEGGTFEALNVIETDALCERINR